MNLWLRTLLYSNITFVIGIIFILEQITEYRFGVLLEISDKRSKLNVFSSIVLQNRLNILENFKAILYDFESKVTS